MDKVFYNLTGDELCDLMCGAPEEEQEELNSGNRKKPSKQGRRNTSANTDLAEHTIKCYGND